MVNTYLSTKCSADLLDTLCTDGRRMDDRRSRHDNYSSVVILHACFLPHRTIPEDEHAAIRWVLEKVFTCRTSDLPPAMLVHRFWTTFSKIHSHGSTYLQCLKNKGINPRTALRGCRGHIKSMCGQRFDPSNPHSEVCKKHLWGSNRISGAEYEPKCVKYRTSGEDSSMPKKFTQYFSCLQQYDHRARQCAVSSFDAPCRNSTIRAVKTVRAEMRQVRYFLQKYPNFHVLHLFRDPRGAVVSMHNQTWAQGMHVAGSMEREATLYCSQVLKDLSELDDLRTKFPDRTRLLLYDDFVHHPLETLKATSVFLGEVLPPQFEKQFVKGRKKGFSNPKDVATAWTKHLSPHDAEVIRDKCNMLFEVPLLRQQ